MTTETRPESAPYNSERCQEYRLDLVDFATGERTFLTREKQKKLIQHLSECQTCQDRFLDYEDIYATAVAGEHTKSPEFQKKMSDVISRLKSDTTPGLPASLAVSADRQAGGPDRPANLSRNGTGREGGVKPIRGAMLDHEAETGTLAGKVWRCLAKYGEISQADLPQKAKLHPLEAHEGLGWLMHQKKVYKTKDKQTIYLYLNETEREIYQQQEARV